MARTPRLRRSNLAKPGIRRRRRGRGWSYTAPDGSHLTDAADLARIRDLVIPPAWTDVWISPWPNGHIQAVGTDAAGRRQYRYHDRWRTRRDASKFDRVLSVAERLPAARQRIAADLELGDLGREHVLACATRLLDIGFFRVGGEQYAEANGSYGLATMLREHVEIQDGVVIFDYPAKSGKQRIQALADPAVVEVARALLERDEPGPELLAYRPGADGRERGRGDRRGDRCEDRCEDPRGWVDVTSREVNEYLREVFDADVTAKDFRTWSATVLAAVALAVSEPAAETPTARKRAISRMYREVADYLGNTPAVCRASYVHPKVVDSYQDGATIAPRLAALGAGTADGQLSTQGEIERAVLAMLRDGDS